MGTCRLRRGLGRERQRRCTITQQEVVLHEEAQRLQQPAVLCARVRRDQLRQQARALRQSLPLLLLRWAQSAAACKAVRFVCRKSCMRGH